MKYLKLWEAFKSEILSKTLSFLSESGKEKFMNELRTITNYISYPLSELSDDYFQKLNFDKALQLNYNIQDNPCDAKSEETFGPDGVPGEICQSGRIKRNWGRGTRMVTCEKCGGTGVKPVRNANPKWVKFWFDKNGNYITESAVDGVIRKRDEIFGTVRDAETGIVYNKVAELKSVSQLDRLPTGTKFSINLDGRNTVATLFKAHFNPYMIQNVADGSEPSSSFTSQWKKFGRYAWIITSTNDYRGKAYILKEKNPEEEVDREPNPYDWNAKLNLGRLSISCTEYPDLEEDLKTASFAIVLDILELYKSGYKTVKSTKQEREESKSGALALMTDEEIRNVNAQERLEKISKKIELNPDLTNLKSGVQKIIGSNFVGYHLFNTVVTNELSTLEEYIHYILKSDKVEYYVSRANNLMKNQLQFKKDENALIKRNMDSMISTLSSSMDECDELLVEIINKFKTFMQTMYQMVATKDIKSLKDLKVLRLKLKNVRESIRDSTEFSELWEIIREIVGYLHVDSSPARALRYIRHNDKPSIDMAIQQMDDFVEVAIELMK